MRILFFLILSFVFIKHGECQSKSGDKHKMLPKDWFLLDAKKNKVQGMSVKRAYKSLLKKKKSKTVVVAVIDSGVDIDHEDLQGKIWVNEGEIAGNNTDDDGNGYIDDVHGWNFLGSEQGDVFYETYEYVRLYKQLRAKYDTSHTKDSLDPDYKLYREVKEKYRKQLRMTNENLTYARILNNNFKFYHQLLSAHLGVQSLSYNLLDKVSKSDSSLLMAKNFMTVIYKNYGTLNNIFKKAEEQYYEQAKSLDMEADYRAVVGDDEVDLFEKYYGSPNVTGPDPKHGTHVAGIIAANRKNKLGNRGIAEDVEIMVIRAVPAGDERDKDVANAIRYAADNGADIINMSFGKTYSPNKHVVDSAVSYAVQKGLLLIHAAGNDGWNIDTTDNFPNRHIGQRDTAGAWLEVGASAAYLDEQFASDFSNYGKNEVDVFAPGVTIYSCIPDNGYEDNDGTSMAAPMVAGVAALLKSYYPQLTAAQIKDILIKSASSLADLPVQVPGTGHKTNFGELCKTGAVVNAYRAVQMAELMTRERRL